MRGSYLFVRGIHTLIFCESTQGCTHTSTRLKVEQHTRAAPLSGCRLVAPNSTSVAAFGSPPAFVRPSRHMLVVSRCSTLKGEGERGKEYARWSENTGAKRSQHHPQLCDGHALALCLWPCCPKKALTKKRPSKGESEQRGRRWKDSLHARQGGSHTQINTPTPSACRLGGLDPKSRVSAFVPNIGALKPTRAESESRASLVGSQPNSNGSTRHFCWRQSMSDRQFHRHKSEKFGMPCEKRRKRSITGHMALCSCKFSSLTFRVEIGNAASLFGTAPCREHSEPTDRDKRQAREERESGVGRWRLQQLQFVVSSSISMLLHHRRLHHLR